MQYSLRIKKHVNYTQVFRYGTGGLCPEDFIAQDLTGWSAECRFYTTDFNTPLLVASTANSKMSVNSAGEISLSLLPADIALLQNGCKYRIVLTRPDNYKILALYGEVILL